MGASEKLEAVLAGATEAERAWVLARLAEAPPLSEQQARTIAAIFGRPLGKSA